MLAPGVCTGFGNQLAKTFDGTSCVIDDNPFNTTCLDVPNCYAGFCAYNYPSLTTAQCVTAFSTPDKYQCDRKNHEVCNNGTCEQWVINDVPDTSSLFWQAPATRTNANYGNVSVSYTGHPKFPVTMYIVENGVYEPYCATQSGCDTANVCLVEESYNGFCTPFGYNWSSTQLNTACGRATGLAEAGPGASSFSSGSSPLVWTAAYPLFCGCGSTTGCSFPWDSGYGDKYNYMVVLEDSNIVRTARHCFAWDCSSPPGCTTALTCSPDTPPDDAFTPHYP